VPPLQALRVNAALISIQLGDNLIWPGTADIAAALRGANTNTTLTSLGLGLNDLGDAGVRTFGRLNRLSRLELCGNQIGDVGVVHLAYGLFEAPTLVYLDLSLNHFTHVGASSLATMLKANWTLTSLNMSRNDIGYAGASDIAVALAANTTLRSLPWRKWHWGRFGKQHGCALAGEPNTQ
jgi:Ran GTPase-activating protein (RanGAP) involved in mRNA processing and transport